jgi:hypothetical protein
MKNSQLRNIYASLVPIWFDIALQNEISKDNIEMIDYIQDFINEIKTKANKLKIK